MVLGRKPHLFVPLLVPLFWLLATSVVAAEGDPSGVKTIADDPSAAVNFTWVLLTAALVFFMQAGFALVEAGFARMKNTVNILTKNVMDGAIGGLAFWAFGFALMFGGSGAASGLDSGNSFIGYSGFFLAGDAYDVKTNLLWIFQFVFASAAATIVSGAMAERTKVTAYMAYSFFISAIIYPIYGKWVWGGGWLANLPLGVGARDFAGSGVVHAVGGLVALVGAWMVGPRLGKFNKDGSANTIPGHNMAYVVLGTFILFLGWFGFNPGSTLAATDLRTSVVAVNTLLAGLAGTVSAMYIAMTRTGKADVTVACNGGLAGLVAITAPCAYVPAWSAVLIGAIGGAIMLASTKFVENKLKVDDPVGAVSVHAANGLWGLLALGILADGTYGNVSGLLYGNVGQFLAQIISMVVVSAWALGGGFLVFGLIKKRMGLRASHEEEVTGLDLTEHGLASYVDDEPAVATA